MLMKHILLSYDKMTVKKTTIIKFCIYSITKLRMILLKFHVLPDEIGTVIGAGHGPGVVDGGRGGVDGLGRLVFFVGSAHRDESLIVEDPKKYEENSSYLTVIR